MAEIGHDPARHDAVHHQAMAETGVRRAQHAFAQDAALRMHDGEGSIIAYRADIAEMIGEPLELRHQCTQIVAAFGNLYRERRLDRLRESERIGDRTIAGKTRCKALSLGECRTSHERFDALVDVAQPLLEPHHRLTICREAEMSGLDDAGVHGPDGDLVQALPLDGQESVDRLLARCGRTRSERVYHVPAAEIEPGPRIRQSDRLQPVQAVHRTFET